MMGHDVHSAPLFFFLFFTQKYYEPISHNFLCAKMPRISHENTCLLSSLRIMVFHITWV